MENENLPAKLDFTQDQIQLIKNTLAKGCTDLEFAMFINLSKRYQLDPFRNQIWVVKYGGGAARVFTGRDGFLEIAHRSGKFDGMESGYREEGYPLHLVGWAKVYRKDMAHPFAVEVGIEEYRKDTPAWKDMPKTMIQKVAESQALRKAFSAFGLYSPEEFGEKDGEKPPMKDVTPDVPGGVGAAVTAGAPVIDADAKQADPKKKRQVKIAGKWVDEDRADLCGRG